uniref:Phospholipase A2activating protein putative n=1 Tax=Albugo laibachii Nc14 TaxID=890382 RepID=F0WZM7_9STRA|nr:phospholipase A2activating protein putative [Albugo laibachii Nc14]|eukprot:CCA26952.1 phospholipase A2activating protein putative [Albugo laibachii Nc14]
MTEYRLQCELLGHEGAVRSISTSNEEIWTGSMDSVIRRWKRDPSIPESEEKPTNFYELEGAAIYSHEHWVTAILYSPIPIHLSDNQVLQSAFITGSMDRCIRIFNLNGEQVTLLRGHEGGVTSLAWYQQEDRLLLLSGSWDGTCRIWDTTLHQSLHTIPNHENGVSVLGLWNGEIVTASTGKQVGNEVVDFQLRFWKLAHDKVEMIRSIRDHQGPIRQLIAIPQIGFASCSNDGSIKLRTLEGSCIVTMNHPMNAEGKPGFVLGICMLSCNERLVSVSEDCSARIWKLDGTLVQSIEHPGGLWTVAALPNGNFITGGDDKVARIFTQNQAICLPEAQASLEQAVENARAMQKRGTSVNVDNLIDYDARTSVRGKSAGQIRMFRRNGRAWACQWDIDANSWCDIGEVTGTNSGGVVDGTAYDLIIPVEIEQPGTGEIRQLEIGYNLGQNPSQVAQAFIDRHALNQSYLRQVTDYIIQRSQEYNPPAADSTQTENETAKSTPKQFVFFPAKSYNTFESIKVDKLMATLSQFNHQVAPELQVSEGELKYLEEVVQIIKQTAFYHASTFSQDQIKILRKIMTTWPIAQVYPALDLARLVLVHPQGYHLTDQNLVMELLKRGEKAETPNVPIATRFLSLRIVANMFLHSDCRVAIMKAKKEILGQMENYLEFRQKLVLLSFSTILVNFSRLQNEFSGEFSSDEVAQIITLAMKVVEGPLQEISEDTLLRVFVAIGSLILERPEIKEMPLVKTNLEKLHHLINSEGLQSYISAEATRECLKELKEIFSLHENN